MSNSRYVLTWIWGLAFVIASLPAQSAGNPPVLLWSFDEDGPKPAEPVGPGEETSMEEFGEIVSKIRSRSLGGTHERPILVFRMESFCVEDLTEHKASLSDLKNNYSVTYLPNVDSPLSVLKNLSLYNESSAEFSDVIPRGQVVITELANLDVAVDTFKKASKSSSELIGVITAPDCVWSKSQRTRRAITESPEPANGNLVGTTATVINTSRILLYYASDPELIFTEKESVSYQLLEVKQEGNGSLAAPLALNFVYSVPNGTTPANGTVILTMYPDGSAYWKAKARYQVKDEEPSQLATQSYFVFSRKNSYHCSGTVRFYQKHTEKQPGIDFKLKNFQMQVDPKNSSRFGEAFDCVGFTSVPIWSGLFVTIILGLIMIWGLIMIMDIRTMDRFDDPKGKTITITASE